MCFFSGFWSTPTCNYRNNGQTIDLWIKLKIYLENRCSGHEMEPSMVKFCPLVLLPR